MTKRKCAEQNGAYRCQRPEGHDGLMHVRMIRERRDGRVYQRAALWTDAESAVRFSIPTWIG